MVRTTMTALLVCAISVASGAVRADSPPASAVPVLAVLKFQDESGAMPFQGGAGRALTNMLGTELSARAGFTVVERRKLAAILEEQDLAQSGLLKPGEGARIGQLTGAQYLVMGTITAFEDNAETKVTSGMFRRTKVESVSAGAYLAVDLRVVDTSTGYVRYARTIYGHTGGSTVDLSAPDAGMNMVSRPGESRAVRAAAIAIIDYLECAMIKRDDCIARFAEQDQRRVDTTRKALRMEGDRK
jgi:curli biogenesis system outer membrane secretion channel CsgG